MPIDPFAALNALIRAEATRSADPDPAPPTTPDPTPQTPEEDDH
ncbi:hypothetical protein [Streptomyces sp. CB03234]|nr:hypothetical protein [Streptomyces sp. CB03234]